MKLPSFICIGAQKAGTTSLQDILQQHPDIYLSPIKEIKYFHRDEHYSKGIEWYSQHFKEALPHQIIGDITPDYILYANTAERIATDLGRDIKIIAILRNPVDRTFSQFNFHRAAKVEKESDFNKIIKNYPPIDYENNTFINWFTPSYYIERSLYYHQLKRYFDIFPKENIHIAIFEELFGNQHDVEINKLYAFLGLEKPLTQSIIHSHSTRVPKENMTSKMVERLKNAKNLIKPIIPQQTYIKIKHTITNLITEKPNKLATNYKNELYERFFKEDVIKLEALIEKDLSLWQ